MSILEHTTMDKVFAESDCTHSTMSGGGCNHDLLTKNIHSRDVATGVEEVPGVGKWNPIHPLYQVILFDCRGLAHEQLCT